MSEQSERIEAIRLLNNLGFRDISIKSHTGDRIYYTHSDGTPVLDAVPVLVKNGKVELGVPQHLQ